jgi:TonB family protein
LPTAAAFILWLLLATNASLALAQPTSAPSITAPVLQDQIVAPYPPAALAAEIEGVVLLELSINQDGAVTEVIIKEPAGFGFDEAAVSAAKQFRFTPAMQNGQPIASRLPYRYRFSLSAKGRSSPAAAPLDFIGETPLLAIAEAQFDLGGTGIIRGKVKVQSSQRPIRAVIHVLTEPFPEDLEKSKESRETIRWINDHTAASDATALIDGAETFSLDNIPSGPFSMVVIPTGDYEAIWYTDEINPNQTLEFNFNVLIASKDNYGLTVRAASLEPQVIKRTIDKEEILKGAGTQGDALKAITNLPGLARAPLSSGILVVRGSAPEDTRAQLLGAWVPQLYHLTGGTAALNTELIQQIDFFPGAYGVRYGRVNGGIIEVTPGTGDPETIRASADVDVFDAGFVVRGPINEDTSFAFAARRSYIDTVLPFAIEFAEIEDIALQTAPRSWDYEGVLQWHPSKNSTLRLLGLGSGDGVSLVLQEDEGELGLFNGGVEGASHQYLLLAAYDEKRGKSTRKMTLSYLWFGFEGTFGPNVDGNFSQNGLTARYIEDRAVWKGGTIGFGGDLFASEINAGGTTFLPPQEGEETPPFGIDPPVSSIVTEAKWTDGGIFTDLKQVIGRATLIPGVRLDRMGGTKEWKVQPRAGLTYALSPTTLLRTSAGFYAQDPIAFELDKNLGNPDLSPETSFQIATGGTHTFERWQLDLDGFYKKLDDVISRQGAGQSAAEITNNSGEGWVWGVEMLAKIAPGQKVSGWVAYTYSRSLRQDTPESELRSFDFDQPHVLTMLGSYQLPKRWSVSGRWRFASGNPSTPIAGAIFDADLDVYIPVPGEINSGRDPAFHQLDVRVDKTVIRNQWQLTFYLDVQNAYNHKNIEGTAHNFDYSDSAFFTGLPVLPSFGVAGTFIGK